MAKGFVHKPLTMPQGNMVKIACLSEENELKNISKKT
jgi:hypothetical protein